MNAYHTIRFSCVCVSVCLCVLCSGCSTAKKIRHLSPLLTLKNYSDSQEEIARYVERQDALFDEMVAQIKSSEFLYHDAKDIRSRFGDPVFKRPAVYQGQDLEEWLYRHSKDVSGAKVYLYVDADGYLVSYVYEPDDEEEQNEQETAQE